MNIKVNDIPSTYLVEVKHISLKERCEKQLDEIIKEMNLIKNNLKEELKEMSKIKDYAEKKYGEEFPDLTDEKVIKSCSA